LRKALLADGAKLLQSLISQIKAPDDQARPGEKCHRSRPVVIHSLLGTLHVRRNYYYHPDKPAGTCGRCPLDQKLGLFGHWTPGLAKIATRAAAQSSYEEACDDLKNLAGLEVGPRQLQRLAQEVGAALREKLKRLPDPPPPPLPIPVFYVEVDGTGVPMNKASLQGVKGRGPEGSAKTREVKVGCVFTQTNTDEEGHAVRDESSTTWIAGFEQASDFGPRMREEARRRSVARAQRVVLLGDGASWIWELARNYFPDATCILDFWHASEYLSEMAQLLRTGDKPAATKLYEDWRGKMAESKIQEVLREATAHQEQMVPESVLREGLQKKIN